MAAPKYAGGLLCFVGTAFFLGLMIWIVVHEKHAYDIISNGVCYVKFTNETTYFTFAETGQNWTAPCTLPDFCVSGYRDVCDLDGLNIVDTVACECCRNSDTGAIYMGYNTDDRKLFLAGFLTFVAGTAFLIAVCWVSCDVSRECDERKKIRQEQNAAGTDLRPMPV
jgi:hypothetical protein